MGKTFNTGRLGNGLFVDANGNVGIGTSSPNDLFEVRGGFIRLSATTGNGPQFNLYSNNQTSNHITLAQGFALATDNIGYLYNRANADFVFGTNNSERLRISSGGNVGIGITAPTNKLHVYGTATVFDGMMLENSNSNAYVVYQAKTGNSSKWQWGVWNDNSYRIGVSGVADYLQITTRGMIIYPGAPLDNINIDTSNPISVASGGTISFETFSGLIIVNNMANGVCAMWLVGAGYTSLVGASYGGAAGSMSYSGAINGYVWTSTYGATANYGVFAVRTRKNA